MNYRGCKIPQGSVIYAFIYSDKNIKKIGKIKNIFLK